MVKRDKTHMARTIARLRKESGLSAAEVGEAVGRSGKTVSAWEADISEPSAECLIALCRLFGAPISEFYPHDVVDVDTIGTVTPHEYELLSVFRSCSDTGRDAAIAAVRGISAEFPA